MPGWYVFPSYVFHNSQLRPIYQTRDIIQPLVITPGKELNSKYGVYRHSDLVGVPYGSKVRSRNGKGFFHLLRPTPELWTLALPHRTQILYLADIAFVVSWLDLKLGSKVIEAGALLSRQIGLPSSLLARSIRPNRLFSVHSMPA